ncbi:MBL fold metallo-hydrolase [Leucobacter sp. CSA1]|uniref:MBL fold metallo-hydrolase n=1 Tax=Leucobacter chromiisoli TaxID=2796471 RepID=A0A934Q9F0_9MICO|nr:MBL fold metallo-hydrolase [Leucobacter chromiisoli]MBK0420203.1 MBL fold metallo-hydrolase [Leucobacter chromiisoli]
MPSQIIEDRPDCTVRRLFVSEMNNAVYLITAKRSGDQILIDAADDADALEALLREGAHDVGADAATADAGTASAVSRGAGTASTGTADAGSARTPARLRFIATTHAHWDHTRAVAELAAATGAEVAIGRADAARLLEERGVSADLLLDDGDRLEVDGLVLDVIALQGHTPGSVTFATVAGDPALLFTGDSLFPGGLGNTEGDPERFDRLYRDVTEKLFDRYPDGARVYPGHGEATTLGAERPALPEWRARGW